MSEGRYLTTKSRVLIVMALVSIYFYGPGIALPRELYLIYKGKEIKWQRNTKEVVCFTSASECSHSWVAVGNLQKKRGNCQKPKQKSIPMSRSVPWQNN